MSNHGVSKNGFTAAGGNAMLLNGAVRWMNYGSNGENAVYYAKDYYRNFYVDGPLATP
jgi:hypothetical protein